MAELVLGSRTSQTVAGVPVRLGVPPPQLMPMPLNGQSNNSGHAKACHSQPKSILFAAKNPLAQILLAGNGLTALSVKSSNCTIPATHSANAAGLLANGNVEMPTNNISTSWNRSNIILEAAQAMANTASSTGDTSAPKTPAKAKLREADDKVSMPSKKRSCPGKNPSESTTTRALSSTCGEAKRKLSKIVVKSPAPAANPLQTTVSSEAAKSPPEAKPKLGDDAGSFSLKDVSIKPIKGKRQCFQFTMSGLVPKNNLPKRIYKKPMERPKTPTHEVAANESRAKDHTTISSPRHHASDSPAALNYAPGNKAQNCASPGAVPPTPTQSTKPPLQPQTPMLISTLSPAVPRPEKNESSTPWYQQNFSGMGASIMTTPRKNQKMFCQFQSDSPGLALVADAAIISSSRDKEERNRKRTVCDTSTMDVLEKSEKRSLAIALPTLPTSISGKGLGMCPPIRSLKMRRHPRSEIGPGSIC